MATGHAPDHSDLDAPGGWRRLNRFWRPGGAAELAPIGRAILRTGKTGTLGRALAVACAAWGLRAILTDRASLDLTSPASTAEAIATIRPWAVVNAAGYIRVDEADAQAQACLAANAVGAESLAAACAASGVRLVTFSSDPVFDGAAGRPYLERDAPCPLNVYGLSKAEAERRVL